MERFIKPVLNLILYAIAATVFIGLCVAGARAEEVPEVGSDPAARAGAPTGSVKMSLEQYEEFMKKVEAKKEGPDMGSPPGPVIESVHIEAETSGGQIEARAKVKVYAPGKNPGALRLFQDSPDFAVTSFEGSVESMARDPEGKGYFALFGEPGHHEFSYSMSASLKDAGDGLEASLPIPKATAGSIRLVLDQARSVQIVPSFGAEEKDLGEAVEVFARLSPTESVAIRLGKAPSEPYSFSRSAYEAAIIEDGLSVSALLDLTVHSRDGRGVKLADGSVALRSVTVNGSPYPVKLKDKAFVADGLKAGTYKVAASWLQPINESQASRWVAVPLIACPISSFAASAPGESLNMEIVPGLARVVDASKGRTTTRVSLPMTDEVKIAWTEKPPETRKLKAAEEEVPRTYLETSSVIKVDEGLMSVETELSYSVLRGEIAKVSFSLPKSVEVMSVEGSFVKDWEQENEDDERTYQVYLDRKVKGDYKLRVSYEGLLEEFPAEAIEAPRLTPREVEREKGVIFIERSPDLEIKTVKTESLRRLDGQRSGGRSALYALQYIKAPYELVLSVGLKPALDPEVHVETSTLVTVSDNVISAAANLDYKVLNAGVDSFRLGFPGDVKITAIRGRDVQSQTRTKEGDRTEVLARLERPAMGQYRLYVEYERALSPSEKVAAVPLADPMGVSSAEGFVGVAARHNVEVRDKEELNLRQIDPSQLRGALFDLSESMILRAYSYSYMSGVDKRPVLSYSVLRHQDVAVQDAYIDEARYLTLVRSNGFSITKAVLSVRNKNRQNLKLTLPEGSELWSAFLAGEPVPPARDENGAVLIPLPRSDLGSGGRHANFPVEVVYKTAIDEIGTKGKLDLVLPRADIVVGKAVWQLYLPLDKFFIEFGGSMGEGMIEQKSGRDVAAELGEFALSLSGNFLKFQAKAKQSEAKSNLGAVFTSQAAHKAEFGRFARDFKESGWAPEGKTQYTYIMGSDRIAGMKEDLGDMPGIEGARVDDDHFLVLAVGNVDNDSFLDIWVIDENKKLINLANDATDSYDKRFEEFKEKGYFNQWDLAQMEYVQEHMRQSEIRGLLSLRIDVPTKGQLVRFEKLFPGAQGEELRVMASYMPDIIGKVANVFAKAVALGIAAGLFVLAALAVRRTEKLGWVRRHWWLTILIVIAALILALRLWG